MEPQRHLIEWLKDAHAMEEKAAQILERQEERFESYPDAQLRIRQHRDETKRQSERVAQCISRLDGETSGLKDLGGIVMGNFAAMANAMAEDEVVKNAIGDYAFEHFEVACYTSLIAAAEAVGDEHTAEVCREILEEEEAMANWLQQHLPEVTTSYLERDAVGLQAKR